MKKLAQPTRSFFTLKISWKTSPGWLQLVFHFGTENRADQLKKPPCITYKTQKQGWKKAHNLKMIPGLGRAHLFSGSHKRGVQAAWYKVVSLVFIVFVLIYNCQLFWSNVADMLDKQVQRYPRRTVSPMGSQVECKIHQNTEKSFFLLKIPARGENLKQLEIGPVE